MKTKISILMVILSFLMAGQVHALGDKIFTSSGEILPGEEWNNVSIYNDTTVVDMLGGFVDSMGSHDASTLNVFDGYVNTLDALQFSRINVSGGDVYGLDVWDYASAYLSGDAQLFAPRVRESGVLNMTAGTVDHLGAIDSGTINLYGGTISDRLTGSQDALINIYGHDLIKTSFGGAYGYGQVYGFWLDNTPFTIDLNGAETYQHINLVPEPSSLLLLAGGLLVLRR